MVKFSWISHGILMLIFSGCASFKSIHPEYVLKIHAKEGQIDHTSIEISRDISYYKNGELSHQTIRNLSFKVKSQVETVKQNTLWVKNTTLEKKGEENLRGFGFPELGETLRLKLNIQGKVLHVDGEEKESVFYLPPIILPKGAVKKGDIWSETFQWKGENASQQFQTTFTSQFLGIDSGEKKEILRIKLKAETLWMNAPKSFTFLSFSEGYYLWDLLEGKVVYSESLAKDAIQSNQKNMSTVTTTKFVSRTDEALMVHND